MEDSVKIQPLLLNSNDNFTLNILLNDYDESLYITTRIKGIKSIGPYKKSKFTIVNLAITTHFFIGILGMFGTRYGRENNSDFISDVGIVAFAIYMTLAVLVICIAIINLLKQQFYRD